MSAAVIVWLEGHKQCPKRPQLTGICNQPLYALTLTTTQLVPICIHLCCKKNG